MPCLFNSFLANPLDVSIWARFCFGPITFILELERASAMPLSSGFSGPIMTNPILWFFEKLEFMPHLRSYP